MQGFRCGSCGANPVINWVKRSEERLDTDQSTAKGETEEITRKKGIPRSERPSAGKKSFKINTEGLAGKQKRRGGGDKKKRPWPGKFREMKRCAKKEKRRQKPKPERGKNADHSISDTAAMRQTAATDSAHRSKPHKTKKNKSMTGLTESRQRSVKKENTIIGRISQCKKK